MRGREREDGWDRDGHQNQTGAPNAPSNYDEKGFDESSAAPLSRATAAGPGAALTQEKIEETSEELQILPLNDAVEERAPREGAMLAGTAGATRRERV